MLTKEEVSTIFLDAETSSPEELRHELAQMIDQTLLNPQLGFDAYKKWIEASKDQGFASLCVSPLVVPLALECLADSETKVCSVINFPLGFEDADSLSMQAINLLEDGVDEIDMVMPYGALKAKEYDFVKEHVERVYTSALNAWDYLYAHDEFDDEDEEEHEHDHQGLVFKVILECSELSDEEICIASDLISSIGVDFIKTSTGFSSHGADLHDVVLMSQTKEPGCQIKASGGIRDLESVVKFINAGATRIGCSKGLEILAEFDELFAR